jgi:arsenate reductase-like glutaredoxin family protein
MSCKKAQGFLEEHDVQISGEVVNAGKERRGPDEALELAKSADVVVVARGKKVVTFDMKKDPPDDATLVEHLIGPTGSLRAPTVRRGKTLLVGFGEEAYRQVLGK